jgi:hypothetical protein
MQQAKTSPIRLMSIGERIAGLSTRPEWPEENWRRTDPDDFFIPADDVVNSFGQTVMGSHLAASPYKIQFKTLSADEMKSAVKRLFNITTDAEDGSDNMDEGRVVLLELNNGGLSVLSCAAADSWVGRLEIASRPARPEAVMRDSAIAVALAERLQVCAPSELVLRIPRFEHQPLVLCAIETDSAFQQSYANLTIDLADDATADVAVVHGANVFSHHRLTLRVGRNAVLNQLWCHAASEAAPQGKMLLERKVKLGAHARFSDASVFVPAGVLRVISNIVPEAEGSEANCGTAIVAAGQAVVDYEPLQDHVSARAQTHLRAKMIAGQRAKAIFQGLINVERDAPGTVASQVNKNLVLSKRARIDAMPRLRILPDEVSCKHGSATGEIDDRQVYYLQTRGFTEQQAKAHIVGGFILDGLAQLPQNSPLQNLAGVVLEQGLTRVLG